MVKGNKLYNNAKQSLVYLLWCLRFLKTLMSPHKKNGITVIICTEERATLRQVQIIFWSEAIKTDNDNKRGTF